MNSICRRFEGASDEFNMSSLRAKRSNPESLLFKDFWIAVSCHASLAASTRSSPCRNKSEFPKVIASVIGKIRTNMIVNAAGSCGAADRRDHIGETGLYKDNRAGV